MRPSLGARVDDSWKDSRPNRGFWRKGLGVDLLAPVLFAVGLLWLSTQPQLLNAPGMWDSLILSVSA